MKHQPPSEELDESFGSLAELDETPAFSAEDLDEAFPSLMEEQTPSSTTEDLEDMFQSTMELEDSGENIDGGFGDLFDSEEELNLEDISSSSLIEPSVPDLAIDSNWDETDEKKRWLTRLNYWLTDSHWSLIRLHYPLQTPH